MNSHRIRQHLHRIAKSRLALSTVVTSLIILVIAVLLAGVVTYFAINVTSTRVQEESLALAKQHVWFDYVTEKAQAAIMVINAGGRDVVVDRLTVRGQSCAWSKVFYAVTSDSISGDLFANSTLLDGGTISVGGQNRVFKQATNDLTVQSGRTLIIYLDNPDSISVNDVGLTVSVNIFTSQAMYYKETNVQGTSGTQIVSSQSIPDDPGTSSLIIQYAAAYYDESNTDQVGLILTNPTSSNIMFYWSSLYINGVKQDGSVTPYFCISSGTLTSDLPYYNSQQIQGYTLMEGGAGFTVFAGQSWIMYFAKDAFFKSSDVGTSVSVKLLTDPSDFTNTKHINIQQHS